MACQNINLAEQVNPKIRDLLEHLIDELNQYIRVQGYSYRINSDIETYIDISDVTKDKLLLEINKTIVEIFDER